MNYRGLLETLCRWDRRREELGETFDADDPLGPEKGCHCDACFYGRHKLADYCLELLARLRMCEEE